MNLHRARPARGRPAARDPPAAWQRLAPIPGLRWTDLTGPGHPFVLVELHALLDAGIVEAWIDERDHVCFLPARREART